MEALALLPVQALDEEALALVDDVLFPSEADDCVVLVGHGSQKRGPCARATRILAGLGGLRGGRGGLLPAVLAAARASSGLLPRLRRLGVSPVFRSLEVLSLRGTDCSQVVRRRGGGRHGLLVATQVFGGDVNRRRGRLGLAAVRGTCDGLLLPVPAAPRAAPRLLLDRLGDDFCFVRFGDFV